MRCSISREKGAAEARQVDDRRVVVVLAEHAPPRLPRARSPGRAARAAAGRRPRCGQVEGDRAARRPGADHADVMALAILHAGAYPSDRAGSLCDMPHPDTGSRDRRSRAQPAHRVLPRACSRSRTSSCSSLWSIVAEIAIIIAWFAALFTGRVPAGLHNFIASWLRYATHVYAYLFLLADPYPPFSGSERLPDRPAGRARRAADPLDDVLPHHPRDPRANHRQHPSLPRHR